MKHTLIFIALCLPLFASAQTPAYIDTFGVKNKVKWNADILDSLLIGDIRVSSTFVPWYMERAETKRLSTRTVSKITTSFNCGEDEGKVIETFTHDGWVYTLLSTGWIKTKKL